MALQALSKYQNNEKVKTATEKALDCLSNMQKENGGFSSYEVETSESSVQVLVALCQQAGITVTSLPGPAACITALTLSGLPTRRFCFEGFLPADKKERELILEDLASEMRTIILYEAPHHLKRTLALLYEVLGQRRITLGRELTKKFETVMPTTLEKAIDYYENNEPRGEYVLVVEGKSRERAIKEKQESFAKLSIEAHVERYEDMGFDRKEAMKCVAKDRGISKRDVYQYLLNRKK